MQLLAGVQISLVACFCCIARRALVISELVLVTAAAGARGDMRPVKDAAVDAVTGGIRAPQICWAQYSVTGRNTGAQYSVTVCCASKCLH